MSMQHACGLQLLVGTYVLTLVRQRANAMHKNFINQSTQKKIKWLIDKLVKARPQICSYWLPAAQYIHAMVYTIALKLITYDVRSPPCALASHFLRYSTHGNGDSLVGMGSSCLVTSSIRPALATTNVRCEPIFMRITFPYLATNSFYNNAEENIVYNQTPLLKQAPVSNAF